jgi:hypothetical protein
MMALAGTIVSQKRKWVIFKIARSLTNLLTPEGYEDYNAPGKPSLLLPWKSIGLGQFLKM